jgi:hypothetical protein
MDDGELLALAEELDTLTDEAQDALLGELRNRHLDQEGDRLHQETFSEQAVSSEAPVKLVTVATFGDPFSGNLAKGKLESEGIECFIASEHRLGRSFGAGGMLGPIELQVKESDVERADKVLEEIEGSEG